MKITAIQKVKHRIPKMFNQFDVNLYQGDTLIGYIEAGYERDAEKILRTISESVPEIKCLPAKTIEH